jgi:hypothetical protein
MRALTSHAKRMRAGTIHGTMRLVNACVFTVFPLSVIS